MKRFRIFYFLVLFSLIFIGCMKNDSEEFYTVLGTVDKENDSTIIVSDDDERLLVNNAGSLSEINSNERIIAYFSIADQALPTGIDYVVDIFNFSKVLFKPVIELTAENADSIGVDPLEVYNIWLVKDYLNLEFKYFGFDKIHYINLTRAPGEIPTDTIDLEIKHNDNGDGSSYTMNGFVSFDLVSLQSEVKDSVVIHVQADEYYNETYSKFFTYKY